MRQPVCYATIFYLFIYLNPAQRFGRQRAVGDVDKHTTHTGEFRTAHHRAMCLERLESWFLITAHIQVSISLKKKKKERNAKRKTLKPWVLKIKNAGRPRPASFVIAVRLSRSTPGVAPFHRAAISPSSINVYLFIFVFFLKALSQKRKQVDYQRERLRHNQRMQMHLEGTGEAQLHPCSHVCE